MFISRKKYNELSARLDSIDSSVSVAFEQIASINETKECNLMVSGINEQKNTLTDNQIAILSETEKKQVAYALNLCTVSVSQIIDYNDIVVLEQEYDAILNNLNLQTFKKHDALLKVLKQILDTINFFRIQEIEKENVEKEYQQNMKNAIWKAVPNIGVIVAGGNPITMAITAVTQVGIGYMNYRNAKNEALSEKGKQEWELQRAAMEQFHGLRRDLFETAWRLSDIYNFDDKYRLTEKQISHYISILRDSDPLRQYEKLDAISESFGAFPLYWYYKARAAKKICDASERMDAVTYGMYRPLFHDEDTYEAFRQDYKEKALEAFNRFDNIHEQVQFFREDVLAASCALDHISMLDPILHKDKIESLLNKALSLAPDNFEIMQICVMVQSAILKDPIETEKTLRRLVNEDYNTSLNGLLLSRIYYKNRNRLDYDILGKRVGESNIFPWNENDDEANKLYLESRQANILQRFKMLVCALAEKHFKSTVFACWHTKYFYQPSDINQFKTSDLLRCIHESFRDIFSELEQFPFFINPEHYGLQLSEPSEGVSYSIDDAWNTFVEKAKVVRKFVEDKAPEMTYTVRKLFIVDTEETNYDVVKQIGKKISDLCAKDMYNLYMALADSIKKEFEYAISTSFKVVEAEIADSIINEIDKWYERNNISIPKTIENCKDNTDLSVTVASRLFFNPCNYYLKSVRVKPTGTTIDIENIST